MNKSSSYAGKITEKKRNMFDLDSENSLLYLLVVVLLAFFLIFTTGETELSAALSRITGLVILVVLAYMLVTWTSSITEKSDVREQKQDLNDSTNLQVKEISTLLERASEGKTTSQEILHEKIKDIFIIKLKEKEDLTTERVRELMRNPKEFRKVVQDDMISDFILSLEKDSKAASQEMGSKAVSLSPEEKDKDKYKKEYKRNVRKIIQKINEWG